MTEEELQRSEPVKQWLKSVLEEKMFSAVLDMLQRQALPSLQTPPLIPGVHHDTVIAHDDRYRAGWSDAILRLRSLPTGQPIVFAEPEELEWSHVPEVAALEEELNRRQSPTTAPRATPKPKSKSKR